MSSMTSVFVRPAGPAQKLSCCSCVLPMSLSRWKQRRVCPGDAGVMGDIDGSMNRIVVQAGLGRYSGAIHGSRSKKSWRRNPSQISQDEPNEKKLVSDLQLLGCVSSIRKMYGYAADEVPDRVLVDLYETVAECFVMLCRSLRM